MRDFIVSVFEALAWLVFVLTIAGTSFLGLRAAQVGRIDVEPAVGAAIGFGVGTLAAIIVLGLIFTLLDMRASLDRLVQISEDRSGRV